jgi:sulfoxide reductase heme-binding subunit YedZ
MQSRRIIWTGFGGGKAPHRRAWRVVARDWVKPLLFAALLAPAASMLWDLLDGSIAAQPYAPLIRGTGLWGLRLILLGLAITPLAHTTGWGALMRLRRMIGLFAASYSAAHLMLWAKDYGFDWGFLAAEITLRRYLLVGSAAAFLLLPLAATSWRAAMRRLGGRHWQALHRLVYPAALLSLWHTIEAHRVATAEIMLYGSALGILLLWRLARDRRDSPIGGRGEQP